MMDGGGGYGGMGWLGMGLLWLIAIILVVAAVAWLFKYSGNRPDGSSALDILKERYVRGEIDKEEFDRKRKDIKVD
ncbi:SHOCT domain-containing protein [Patescibacteria group bacterium]|nr:SHOCT domain-containing protein [Patescibacteria group bacterium]